MKTLIRKTTLVAALVTAALISFCPSQAENNKLVYHKACNSSIGITVENAAGADYSIKNDKGNIVVQGKVKSDKTFYIPIAKMNAGSYRFFIGNMIIREFSVK